MERRMTMGRITKLRRRRLGHLKPRITKIKIRRNKKRKARCHS